MLGILMKWIKHRLGITVGIVPIQFSEKLKDGTLIGQILQSYGLITYRDLQLLQETSDPVTARKNFEYLIQWLADLSPDFSSIDVDDIINGEGFAGVTFLYQVYLYFESRSACEKFKSLHHSENRTFKTVPVRERLSETFVLEPNPLCAPLLEQWDVVNWKRDHLQAMLNRYKKAREDYEIYLRKKSTREIVIPQRPAAQQDRLAEDSQYFLLTPAPPESDMTYDQLIMEQNRAEHLKPYVPNTGEAKKMMKRLRVKLKQQERNNILKLQLQKELLSTVWEELKMEEEKEYNKEVSAMLYQKCAFEKKMAKSLFEAKQKKAEIIENRIKADIEEQKKRDAEFIRALFEDDLEARLRFHDERQAQIDLHRKLYAEKMLQKKLKHEKLCRDIASDLVDVALKTAEYKQYYDMEPCERVRREWATLFVKQQPLYDLEIPVSEIFQNFERLPEIVEDIYRKKIAKQDVLDRQDFEDYHGLKNVWNYPIENEEVFMKMTLGMNVLGYIVHKLLLKKYPYRVPQKPDLSAEIEIAACAAQIIDSSRLPYLQHLLNFKGVKVVQIEEAQNFCLEAFKREMTTEYESKLPEDMEMEELKIMTARQKQDKKEKGKKGKGGKKGGGKKSDKSSKSSKGSKKGDKKSKKGKGGKKKPEKDEPAEPAKVFEDKIHQTPRIYPGEEIILSNKAQLGKQAKELLDSGEPLTDELIVQMFVEYLLSMPEIKGWVLVNYPENFKQAALLEQALSGKKVSEEYTDKNMNKESLESVEVEMPGESSTKDSSEPSGSSLVPSGQQEDPPCSIFGEDQDERHLQPINFVRSLITVLNFDEPRPCASNTSYQPLVDNDTKNTDNNNADTTCRESFQSMTIRGAGSKEVQFTKSAHGLGLHGMMDGMRAGCMEPIMLIVSGMPDQLPSAEAAPAAESVMTIDSTKMDTYVVGHQKRMSKVLPDFLPRLSTNSVTRSSITAQEVQNEPALDESTAENLSSEKPPSAAGKLLKANFRYSIQIPLEGQVDCDGDVGIMEMVPPKSEIGADCLNTTPAAGGESNENNAESTAKDFGMNEGSKSEQTANLVRSTGAETGYRCVCDKKSQFPIQRSQKSSFDVEMRPESSSAAGAGVVVTKDGDLRQQQEQLQQETSAEGKECICPVHTEVKDETTATSVLDTIGIEETGDIVEDFPDELRLSKLLPYPTVLAEEIYKTPLTAYIKLLKKPEPDEFSDEDSIPIFKELEKSDGLEKFYCDQGCFYLLEYQQEIDTDTVKCLAKVIIGDYSLPLKSSVELFGERYMEASFTVGDNTITKKGKKGGGKKGKKAKKKPAKGDDKKGKKGSKKSGKDKGSKKSKKSDKSSKKSSKKDKGKGKGKKGKKGKTVEEVPKTFQDDETQIPTPEEESIEEIREPRPGEPDWEYVDLPIPHEIEVTLATFWENLEQAYIDNFKKMFFNKRLFLNAAVTYMVSVKNTLNEFISRPDQRQNYLRQFQSIINAIDLDMRSDQNTKDELLCRIEEFKAKLQCMCDEKMKMSEEQRRKLIQDNWVVKQIFEICNNSGVAFQSEIDRFVDSVDLISSYYKGVITKTILEGENVPFKKIQLPKLEFSEDMGEKINQALTTPNSNKSREKVSTISFNKKVDSNVFHQYIDQIWDSAVRFVQIIEAAAYKLMDEMKKLFEAKKKDKKKKKSKKDGGGDKPNMEPDDFVKEKKDAIFDEWQTALAGELARIDVRLDFIRKELDTRVSEIERWAMEIFHDAYNTICKKYENELQSVNKACELLTLAVDQEKIIQPQLILDDEDRLQEVRIALFPQTSTSITTCGNQWEDGSFSMEQLQYMLKILMDLAPDGYIMKDTFLYLLQDIIFESDSDSIVREKNIPKIWKRLSVDSLRELFGKIFDQNEYVQWKDFVVLNLMVPFPDDDQLLSVRQQFRKFDPYMTELVTKEDLYSVKFWFDSCPNLSNPNAIKDTLFDMYKTESSSGAPALNYTAMLLDFCKDKTDPVAGLVKAMELSVGRKMCYREDVGKDFVEYILEKRREDELYELERQREHDCLLVQAKTALGQMVDEIMHRCDSLIISEVESEKSGDTTSRSGNSDEAQNNVENLTNQIYELSQQLIKYTDENAQEEEMSGEDSQKIFLTENRFSNAAIGFECRENTSLAYFLPLELLLLVLGATLPWRLRAEEAQESSFQEEIVQIYEDHRHPDFNQAVLTHEFLNDPRIRELFRNTTKFLAVNPVKLVKKIVEDDDDADNNEMDGRDELET